MGYLEGYGVVADADVVVVVVAVGWVKGHEMASLSSSSLTGDLRPRRKSGAEWGRHGSAWVFRD